MEEPTFAPAYVAFYPMLAKIARECGYSLAIHGSCGKSKHSDLDLVAAPWIDEAVNAEDLMNAIFDYGDTVLVHYFGLYDREKSKMPTVKPHGRLAWKLQLGNGAAIDISVMPRIKP
jgi:hypothetical protein